MSDREQSQQHCVLGPPRWEPGPAPWSHEGAKLRLEDTDGSNRHAGTSVVYSMPRLFVKYFFSPHHSSEVPLVSEIIQRFFFLGSAESSFRNLGFLSLTEECSSLGLSRWLVELEEKTASKLQCVVTLLCSDSLHLTRHSLASQPPARALPSPCTAFVRGLSASQAPRQTWLRASPRLRELNLRV